MRLLEPGSASASQEALRTRSPLPLLSGRAELGQPALGRTRQECNRRACSARPTAKTLVAASPAKISPKVRSETVLSRHSFANVLIPMLRSHL